MGQIMTFLLRKSTLRRMNTFITAFVLTLIILISSFPRIIALSMTNVTISSSGRVIYEYSANLLHIEGRYIKDEPGNIIHLRGVNKHGFEDNPEGNWGAFGYTNWDNVAMQLDTMKSWGINVLREINTIQWWVENSPADTSTGVMTHRDVVKKLIEMAADRGIYYMYTPWCVTSAEGQVQLPFPPYSSATGVIPTEQAFIDYWVSVATELGIYDNVIYDLWNEPTGAIDDWYRVWQKVINAIRGLGDEHLIVVQYYDSVYWNLDDMHGATMSWVQQYPFNGTNLLYSTHAYRDYGSLGQKAGEPSGRAYTYEDVKLALESELINWVGETMNKSLIIGEIGCNLWYGEGTVEQEAELTAFENALSIFNEWGVHYAVWEWWAGVRCALISNPWASPIKPTASGQILINAIAS